MVFHGLSANYETFTTFLIFLQNICVRVDFCVCFFVWVQSTLLQGRSWLTSESLWLPRFSNVSQSLQEWLCVEKSSSVHSFGLGLRRCSGCFSCFFTNFWVVGSLSIFALRSCLWFWFAFDIPCFSFTLICTGSPLPFQTLFFHSSFYFWLLIFDKQSEIQLWPASKTKFTPSRTTLERERTQNRRSWETH